MFHFKGIDSKASEPAPSTLLTREASEGLSESELPEEEREHIRVEVASILEGLASKQARQELWRFGNNIESGELDAAKQQGYYEVIDEQLEELEQEIRAERTQARKVFWKRARLALAPLLVLFATPNQDSQAVTAPSTGSYSERLNAAQQLSEKGITDYQRRAYKGSLSESLMRGVSPFLYSDDISNIDVLRALAGVIKGVVSNDDPERRSLELLKKRARELGQNANVEYNKIQIGNRYDAWRLYLGIPQEHHTFDISNHKPEQGTQDRYYYKIRNFLQNTQRLIDSKKELHGMKPVQLLLELEARQGKLVPLGDPIGEAFFTHPEQKFVPEDTISTIMGHYKLSTGTDELGHYISYYDTWDLGESMEGVSGLVGKPYEIYDRIYYDPSTLEVLDT